MTVKSVSIADALSLVSPVVNPVSQAKKLEVSSVNLLLVSPVSLVNPPKRLEVSLVNPLVNPVSLVNQAKKVRG